MAMMEDEVAVENGSVSAVPMARKPTLQLNFSIRGGTRALRLLSELADPTLTVMRREAENTAYPFLTTYSQEESNANFKRYVR